MKKTLSTVFIALITSIVTFAAAKKYIYTDTPFFTTKNDIENNAISTAYMPNTNDGSGGGNVNLENAAEKSIQAVVHIKIETKGQVVETQNPFGNDDFFNQFFGGGRQYIPPSQGSGSGVIVTADGYIVTNNHVVENAAEVTVTLNDKKTLKAKVIAKDPNTDLALIKIEEKNLPFLTYGNSDNVRIGEWVLAVGYPLNLETTVTAGIVSAKSRSIGINAQKAGASAIESFIQTDAAVNPGNSGGALVDADGYLIGINSAIASPTGSYAGYSYAIPSNLVKKVVEDLMQYGNVQRGYLGINPLDIKGATPEEISSFGLDKNDGVYIQKIIQGGAADNAGLKVGDFITKINGQATKSSSQLQEQIGRYRPGNKVPITYVRNGKENTINIELKNEKGNTSIVEKPKFATNLGAALRTLTKEECKKVGIAGGVLVGKISQGKLLEQTRIKQNFIITQANDENVKSVEDLTKIINNSEGKLQLTGLYPGYQGVYYYDVDLN